MTESPAAAIELRGKMETLLTVALGSTQLDAVRAALAAKVAQAPDFFANAPVILDLAGIADQPCDLQQLLTLLREQHMLPLGARHASEAHLEALSALGLPLLRDQAGPAGRVQSQSAETSPQADAPAQIDEDLDRRPPIERRNRVQTGVPTVLQRPVRSGQQVYARGGDLVLLAAASPGCELIADGSIHVYGPLRGRALCGVGGNRASRIFCRALEAELVSIAGTYRTLDELPPEMRGKPAQIWLDGERLQIEAID
jgi:septum site-determining protein MinC